MTNMAPVQGCKSCYCLKQLLAIRKLWFEAGILLGQIWHRRSKYEFLVCFKLLTTTWSLKDSPFFMAKLSGVFYQNSLAGSMLFLSSLNMYVPRYQHHPSALRKLHGILVLANQFSPLHSQPTKNERRVLN